MKPTWQLSFVRVDASSLYFAQARGLSSIRWHVSTIRAMYCWCCRLHWSNLCGPSLRLVDHATLAEIIPIDVVSCNAPLSLLHIAIFSESAVVWYHYKWELGCSTSLCTMKGMAGLLVGVLMFFQPKLPYIEASKAGLPQHANEQTIPD